MLKKTLHFFHPFTSISQYDRASASRHQPPLTITNELVQIRLMMGVRGFSEYPATTPIKPATARTRIFCQGKRVLFKTCPASTPHMVCAVVGTALNAAQ